MFIFSTDIDGTIYDGAESAVRFQGYWQELKILLKEPPLLVYNTGRRIEDLAGLICETQLPSPDWFITDVGTRITNALERRTLDAWDAQLEPGWDLERILKIVARATPAEPQPPECQGLFKSSWYWKGASEARIRGLERALHAANLPVQAVYSSSRDLDILPRAANKGNAVAFLASHLRYPLGRVLVAGDSGNDASMFREDVQGIIVANAESRLKASVANLADHYQAQQPCVLGVIEGLNAYCVRHQLIAPEDIPVNPS